jgi:hemoglobin-like flavoprotein
VTPRQKQLIRRSWPLFRDQSESATELFYRHLFTIDPSARRLFRDKDMRVQGTAFVQMLAMFIRSLDEDEPGVTEAIKASGRRHVGYGVMYTDYGPAGVALLWALEQSLGDRFSPDVRDAWAEAYRTLASTMRHASGAAL